jgi:hypothetical protein
MADMVVLAGGGLALGLVSALTSGPSDHDRRLRLLSWVLVGASMLLGLLLDDPPASPTSSPCLAVHHCVVNVRIVR